MKFGEKLKNARIRADLTQEQVIKQIGVSRQSISNWENDRTYPDLASVVKLSDLYQVSLDDLLREDMELRRQMEKQQERMKKLCSFLLSIVILFLGGFCLCKWMDNKACLLPYCLVACYSGSQRIICRFDSWAPAGKLSPCGTLLM